LGRQRKHGDYCQKRIGGNKMSEQEIKTNLCYYDPENPNSNLDAYDDEDLPQPRTEGCCCDNCFYGRDKLAMQLIEAKREREEARDAILGWENKWKCAVDIAARAELERDEALKCAKEYYVEFIRNASSDNKVSKPNPLNPLYKLT
jgi:hypothetical protein